ncbi:hypothetical protein N2152v2_006755 [Parachlorella kessleri]
MDGLQASHPPCAVSYGLPDVFERVFQQLGPKEWAACSLSCRTFYNIVSSSRFFFPGSRLELRQDAANKDSSELHSLALRRLERVGKALHSATLAGASCSSAVLVRLPSLRSLHLREPLSPPDWAQLASLPHLRSLVLEGVQQLGGLLAMRACTSLKTVTVAITLQHQLPPCPDSTAQLAQGLPGLAAITQLVLQLPEWAESLNEAVGTLPQLASLSVTTTHKPRQDHGSPGDSDGGSHANRQGLPSVRPACWAGNTQLTQLILNLAGDCTPVLPGLSRLSELRRLSVVGAGGRSPEDLFDGGGHYHLESLAVAGTGGLPTVPDYLEHSMPNLRALEASYGALSAGLYPPQLCLAQLISLDLYNAGLDNTESCPTALPDAFSKITGLRQLSLAKNYLEVVPPSVCALTSLTFLSLWGNRLGGLPGGPYLARLGYLNLASNCLTGLPGALAEAQQLQDLGLTSNPIEGWTQEDAKVLGRIGARLRLLGFGGRAWERSREGQGRPGGCTGGGEAAPSRDLEVALLWVAAREAPGCEVCFDASRFESRFA